jgi:hypothetical protein
MAPLFDHGRCPRTFCFSMHVRRCQVVDAWECVMLYPQWKTFVFACFVFQLHFLLLQFFISNFVLFLVQVKFFSFLQHNFFEFMCFVIAYFLQNNL